MREDAAIALAGTNPIGVGVDHEIGVDQLTGRGTVSVPLRLSAGRSAFGPSLTLRYDSSGSPSPFGEGWSLDGMLSVAVSTRRGLPTYTAKQPYTFTLSGELVPALTADGRLRVTDRPEHTVRYWRARRESAHIRVEQWIHTTTGDVHWRTRDAANVLTIYGADASARIADPADPTRVFAWLAQAQYDPAGNAIRYDYLPETLAGVDRGLAHEGSRVPALAQRYLKQIRYGNSHPLASDSPEPAQNRWHLRIVFDYGDHGTNPKIEPDQAWPARLDPHSTYRPGFEVRTYRLCRRILQFHLFDALGAQPSLVAEHRLGYRKDPAGSTLTEIGYAGFRDGEERAVPPLRLEYTRPEVAPTFTEPPTGAMENAPAGLTGAYRWIDLHGEGLSGILCETGHAWYYKPNEGGGSFGAQQLVADRPAYSLGQVSLVDFDADGDPNLAVLHGRDAGYYSYDRDAGQWRGFRPLPTLPHLESARGRAQWLDVNGDGRAELVVSDAERLTVFPALGEDGFDTPVHAALPGRPVGGTDAPFAEDPMLDFFFADMSGDGLAAQVLVRNGRVEYWPQLGHGRFGSPVLMTGSPTFAADGEFDSARVRLVDLDGSGTADLVYLGEHEIRWWRNASGNALVEGGRIAATVDNVSTVAVGDFLGDGTPCLVWSSPLPTAPDALRYLQLTGGVRPNLLTSVDNGRGTHVELHYASSAEPYLADRRAGRHWRTKLPNHVPVVSRHEVIDEIGGGRLVSRFTYHDGVFDAHEQLLMFGAVDRYDAEPDAPSTTASCTRTWHHTGADRVGLHGAYPGHRLAAHVVENADIVAAEEYQHAVASLAGAVLREEVFAVGTDGQLAKHPITVHQRGYRTRRIQPATGAWDASVDNFLAERLLAAHEGEADDPRVTHELVLDVTDAGIPRLACVVGYPRGNQAEAPVQQRMLATAQHTSLLDVDEPDRFELGIDTEHREFELTGLTTGPGKVFDYDDLRASVLAAIAAPVPFHATAPAAQPAARLIEWRRAYFWDDPGQAALPHGQVGAKTRPHHADEASLTPKFAASASGGAVNPAMLIAAGYILRDDYWWRAGETTHYTSEFDLLARSVRSDGAATSYTYDDALFAPVEITDPLGNTMVGELDYRLLVPHRLTDANGTVTETAYDPLGVAVVTTMQGHVAGSGGASLSYGQDPLAAYVPVDAPDLDTVLADPASFVQTASRYVYYDLFAWLNAGVPPTVVELVREEHAHAGDGRSPSPSRIGVSVVHLDGFARVLQSKRLVEPGEAVLRDNAGNLVLGPDGTPVIGPVSQRWLASGHVRYNAKQEPVRRFEPFYSSTPRYEPEAELATFGAAHSFDYDAVGRCVRHDAPNATFERAEFTSWTVARHDANDTVLDSGYRLLREALPAGDPERRAYVQAAEHANTPSLTRLDPLGDEVIRVDVAAAGGADRVEENRLNITRDSVEFIDARGIVAFRDSRDMQGRIWRHESVDAGIQRVLMDPFDRPVHRWDARGAHVVNGFDALDRPTFIEVDGKRVEEVDYGDALANGTLRNAIGLPVAHRDQAGTVDVDAYDPSGRPLRVRRRLTADHTSEPDWSGSVALQPEIYSSERAFDALGRVRREALPDDIVRLLTYLAGGGLERITLSTADGQLTDLPVLDGAEYNARGERARAVLGNGVTLDYTFDPETFRTVRRLARRAEGTPLTDMAYTYDPVGNVVRSLDAVHQPGAAGFITGLNVSAEATYSYDEFYRLVGAAGRVHQALLQHDHVPDGGGFKGTRHLSFNNGAAVERYTRTYAYDLAGNLTQVRHLGASRTWTTDLWVSPGSNRSLPAIEPSGVPVVDPESQFDAAGNTIRLDHLRRVDWTYRGSLARAVLIERAGGQPDDAEYYSYDGDGQRVRKVYQRLVSGNVQLTEKIYLDGCEIKRIRSGGNVVLERITSHIADETGRLALVHRWRVDDASRETDDVTSVRVRYQLGNHLASAQLELDESGQAVGYEEYFPYGGTAFIAGDAMREVRMRDYRFCGKESDDATGLYYYGFRYYAPWMGRWLSPDPIGPQDHPNLYVYTHDNPVSLYDPDGLQTTITPTANGREFIVSVPEFPPELQGVRMTAEQIKQWNARQLTIVRLPGSPAPTTMSNEEYRELVRKETAAGRDVKTYELRPGGKGAGDGDGGGADAGEDKTGPGGEGKDDKEGAGGKVADGKDGAGDQVGGEHGEDGTGGQGEGPDGDGLDSTGSGTDGAGAGTKEGTGAGGKGSGAGAGKKDVGPGQGGGGKGSGEGPGKKDVRTGGGGKGGGTSSVDGVPGGSRFGVPGGTLGGEEGGQLGGVFGGDVGGVPGGALGGAVGGSLDGGLGRSGGRGIPGGTLPQPGVGDTARPGQGANSGRGGAGGGTGRGDRTGQNGNPGPRAPQPGVSPGAGSSGSRAGGDGGNPGGASGNGPGGVGGGGTPTTMDRVAKVAGYTMLESGGDPGGESGGVPGGRGSLKGAGWQALYTALSALSLATLFSGAGIKALFKAISSGLTRFAVAVGALFTKAFWSKLATRVSGWWASRPIGNWLFRKIPWSFAPLRAGVLGSTNPLSGLIKIRPGLSGKVLLETVLHEGAHRFFVPVRGALAIARARVQLWAYQHSHFFKYTFEAIAETVGTGSLRAGLSFPIREGYVTLGRTVTEGLAYLGFFAGSTYGGYLIGDRLFGPGSAAVPSPNPRDPAQPAPSTP